MPEKYSLDEILDAVRASWCRETSGDPDHWSPENPAYFQCTVSALVIQDLCGGELQRFFAIDGEQNVRHTVNILPGGVLLDSTASQFAGIPTYIRRENETREKALAPQDTRRRYNLLRRLVMEDLCP